MLRHGLVARARRASVAALLAAIAPTLLFASPVAAANNITIVGYLGDCFFSGSNAGSSKVVKIEWRDSDGNLKSKHKVNSNVAGNFTTRCEFSEVIEGGDVLKTTIGTAIRSFTVPKITANVSRTADTVSGKVNTDGMSAFTILVDLYEGGFAFPAPSQSQSEPTFTPDTGVQSYTTTSWDAAPDIKGWDDVYAIWENARGDAFVRQAVAEGIRVWMRQPFVELVGNPGEMVSVDLYRGGPLIAEADARLNLFGAAQTSFSDLDGDTARTKPADYVLPNFAADADFIVPNMLVTLNKTTDRVTVDCNITETGLTGVEVVAYKPGQTEVRLGFQNNASNGTFLANFASGGAFNIASGGKVDVYCKMATGDVIAQTFTIP